MASRVIGCTSPSVRASSEDRHGSIEAVLLAILLVAGQGLWSSTPRFYGDDPVMLEVESRDASAVRRKAINLLYHETQHLFATPGDRQDRRALNVNTIDEVPDSAWFVNRILVRGERAMTAADVARGPGTGRGPAPGPWTILSGKREGVTPGLTVLDANRERWFIKFDPPKNPEMATGAEVVVTKLFHALGYHVPENALAIVRRDELVLTEESTTVAMNGAERRMRQDDVDAVLRMAATRPDGSYRVIASKALAGEAVGPSVCIYAIGRPERRRPSRASAGTEGAPRVRGVGQSRRCQGP